MGILDSKQIHLTCPDCGNDEKISILDKGNMYSGSYWHDDPESLSFKCEWEGGGKAETMLKSASCNTYGSLIEIK